MNQSFSFQFSWTFKNTSVSFSSIFFLLCVEYLCVWVRVRPALMHGWIVWIFNLQNVSKQTTTIPSIICDSWIMMSCCVPMWENWSCYRANHLQNWMNLNVHFATLLSYILISMADDSINDAMWFHSQLSLSLHPHFSRSFRFSHIHSWCWMPQYINI